MELFFVASESIPESWLWNVVVAVSNSWPMTERSENNEVFVCYVEVAKAKAKARARERERVGNESNC